MPMLLLLLFCGLITTGCQPSCEYVAPETKSPQEWKECSENVCEPISLEHWWEIFLDPKLNELEELALQSNHNLQIAAAKLMESRAIAYGTCAQLLPTISFNPNFLNMESLFKFPPLPIFATPLERFRNASYILPLQLNYEVDLWGRLRKACESANDAAEASQEDLRTAYLLLTSDVAAHYFRLRALDAENRVLLESIDSQSASLQLTKAKRKSGLANELDLNRSQQLLSQIQADQYLVLQQRTVEENALAVLCGALASEFGIDPENFQALIPEIGAGIPSELLLRRPDIAYAERIMASKHAEIGVEYASLFPSLNFNGIIGYSSPFMRDLLKWKARLWSYETSVSQYIYDGGRRCANIEAAQARYFQSLASYEQTVLQAFQEVENALSECRNLSFRVEELEIVVRSAGNSTLLSEKRQERGLVSYFEVIETKNEWINAKRTLVQAEGDRYIASVHLIKALAGGWSNSNTKVNKP